MASDVLSFRLPSEFARMFSLATRPGESPGDAAKRMVIDKLTHQSNEHLQTEVAQLAQDIDRLRGDFRSLVKVMLFRTSALTGDDTAAMKEAEEWLGRLFPNA